MLYSRKTKIRIPERHQSSDTNLEDVLNLLGDAIDKIFEDNVGLLSFEEIYHAIYLQVIQGQSEPIYNEVEKHISQKLKNVYRTTFFEKEVSDTDNNGLGYLNIVANVWEKLCYNFKLVSDLMIYLDKVYSQENRKLELYDLFLVLFKENILNEIIKDLNVKFLISINTLRDLKLHSASGWNEEKHAEVIDTWKKIISMMELIEDGKGNYFLNQCEQYLIDQTTLYYQKVDLSTNLSLKDYLKHVTDIKSSEFELDTSFLNSDTSSKIITTLDNVLVINNVKDRLSIFMSQCCTEKNSDLLKELYNLSSQMQYKLDIINSIKLCITKDLESCVIDTSIKKKSTMAFKWCSGILGIYQSYSELLSPINFEDIELDNAEQFTANKGITIIRDVFSKFFSQDSNFKTELIALFLDTFIKSVDDKNKISTAKLELDKSVQLLSLLSEKDLLEAFYKQHLSKRLLQQTSLFGLERWMVQKIKEQLGTFFTSNFEGMLRDVQTSNEMLKNYKNLHNDRLMNIEYTPNILTMTAWPFNTGNTLNDSSISEEYKLLLPTKLQEIQNSFEEFYKKKYDQRTLKWSANLSMMIIGYQFEKMFHELTMPLYSAIIFLLFSEHDSLTFKEIIDLTQIPENELKRHLISLAIAPRTRVLKKVPISKTISPTDQFSINETFAGPSRCLKVHTVNIMTNASASRSASAISVSEDALLKERLQILNSAVVRVMKSERRLFYNEILEKSSILVKHRFTVSDSLLQQSINNLVNKDYLQRDPDDKDLYYYLS